MSARQLRKLESEFQNAQARHFRRDISQAERQRLQEKITWLKQRIVEIRRATTLDKV